MEEDDYVESQDDSQRKKKKKNKKAKRNLDTEFDEIDTSQNFTEEIEELIQDAPSTPSKKSKKKKAQKRATQEEEDSDEDNHLVSPKKEMPTPKKKQVAKVTVTEESNQDGDNDSNNRLDGLAIIAQMSQDDVQSLLERVEQQCPLDDIKKVATRGAAIVWDDVQFSGYGPHQCKIAWEALMAQTRKYRIMYELVQEVKYNLKVDHKKFLKKAVQSAPDYPKQPYASGGFQCYCKEKWDQYKARQEAMNQSVVNFVQFQQKCQAEWKALDPQQQKSYDQKVKLLQAEYHQKVNEFYAKYPNIEPPKVKLNKDGKPEPKERLPSMKQILKKSLEMFPDAPTPPMNPLQLFLQHKLKQVKPEDGDELSNEELATLKARYVQKWKNLSDNKKLKWIQKCVTYWEKFSIELTEYKRQNPMFILPKEYQLSKLVNKEELGIWMKDHGVPPNPKNTIFEFFLEEFRNSPEAEDIPEEDFMLVASQKWKNTTALEKERYTLNYRMEKLNFKVKLDKYLDTVPTVLKPCVLDILPKHLKKQYLEEVGKQSLVNDGEELEVNIDGNAKRNAGNATATPGKTPRKRKRGTADDEESVEAEVPLYASNISDESLKALQQQFKDAVQPNTSKKRPNYGKTLKAVNPAEDITPRILTETIRGIFDARQNERKFTVYYYYAKYVAKEKCWINLYNEIGIFETATRIIETFGRLPPREQRIFTEEAQQFHIKHHYYRKIASDEEFRTADTRHFPEEPRAPPRKAALLYNAEMKARRLKQKNSEPVTPWDQLDEQTQLDYTKKLYQMTREYVRKYDAFVRNMTPNDMVEYLVRKSMNWEYLEGRYKFKYSDNVILSSANAVDVSTSRCDFSLGVSSDTQAVQPNLLSFELRAFQRAKLASSTCRYKKNPFAVTPGSAKKRVEDICSSYEVRRKLRDRNDSDLPSSTSDEDDQEYGNTRRSKAIKERDLKHRSKLRAIQRYSILQQIENANAQTSSGVRDNATYLPPRHMKWKKITDLIQANQKKRTKKNNPTKKNLKQVRNVKKQGTQKKNKRAAELAVDSAEEINDDDEVINEESDAEGEYILGDLGEDDVDEEVDAGFDMGSPESSTISPMKEPKLGLVSLDSPAKATPSTKKRRSRVPVDETSTGVLSPPATIMLVDQDIGPITDPELLEEGIEDEFAIFDNLEGDPAMTIYTESEIEQL